MTTTEVAALAEGLTSGQRAVLLETAEGQRRLYEAAPGIPRVALFAKGLLQSDGDLRVLPLYFVATPLGLAVRNHLLASGGA